MKTKPETQDEYEGRLSFIAYKTAAILGAMTISTVTLLYYLNTASPTLLITVASCTLIFGLIGLKMIGFKFSGRYQRRT